MDHASKDIIFYNNLIYIISLVRVSLYIDIVLNMNQNLIFSLKKMREVIDWNMCNTFLPMSWIQYRGQKPTCQTKNLKC